MQRLGGYHFDGEKTAERRGCTAKRGCRRADRWSLQASGSWKPLALRWTWRAVCYLTLPRPSGQLRSSRNLVVRPYGLLGHGP